MHHNIFKPTVYPRFVQSVRQISSSTTCFSRSCFRNIFWDRRGNQRYREMRKESTDPLLATHDYGDRKPGITKEDGSFQVLPELIPDIIVPVLTNFKLKPYVSYRAPELKREEFTARQLFDNIYRKKIVDDFNNNGLLEDGTPKEPSEEESLTAEVAYVRARRTGSDIFAEDPKNPDPEDRIYLKK